MHLRVLGRVVRGGIGLLVACAAATLAAQPAVAAEPAPIEFAFADDYCKSATITVTNHTNEAVDYQLARKTWRLNETLDSLSFTVAANSTREHRWQSEYGHTIVATSSVLAAPVTYEFDDNGACGWSNPEVFLQLDCSGNAVFGVMNGTTTTVGGLAFAQNGKPTGLFALEPRQSRYQVHSGLNPGDRVSLMRKSLSGQLELVEWDRYRYREHPKCGQTPPATVSQTCEGIHIETVNTQKASKLVISYPREQTIGFEAVKVDVAAGEKLVKDVTIPRDGVVMLLWEQMWDTSGGDSPAAAFIVRDSAKACATPSVSAPQPSSPAGQPSASPHSGGLAVTGAPVGMFAAVGAVLLALGAGLVLIARRRRSAA
ncbi:hypothetical protein AB0C02_03430 [Micromonospora sp. NPDC048999]|uniref:hypothetical protein n=1 Tax=Micromonospora sp. NPDC048999 TaxID=3155391 RepID=UPI00340E5A27